MMNNARTREDDRHLMAAEVPSARPDILIVEGLIYAIFPEGMKKLLNRMIDMQDKKADKGV